MIIDKMKILDHLTIQEKYLVDYIINNQEDILKKNTMQILWLLHIIRQRNVHSMQWMIHRMINLH